MVLVVGGVDWVVCLFDFFVDLIDFVGFFCCDVGVVMCNFWLG